MSGSGALGGLKASFAADVAEAARPSVALLFPKGVRDTKGQGSGFVMSFDGKDYICTNAHVAWGGMEVSVQFPNQTEPVVATLVGRAPGGEDLAFLSLPAGAPEGVRPLPLGDSDAMRLGEPVIALGYPGGMPDGAVTLGVLSGRQRVPPYAPPPLDDEPKVRDGPDDREPKDDAPRGEEQSARGLVPFLVADAALAGGMSGGPLLNVNGEVVGVSTFINQGLRGLGNFFIESNALREVIATVVEKAQNAGEAKALRLVLYNDPINKRKRVAEVLTSVAGLTKKEADSSMMAAHTTGRGLVKVFAAEDAGGTVTQAQREEAESLRARLAAEDILVELERV